jgi:hypothetical protein
MANLRCGDCKNFIVDCANSAASEGICNVFLDDEGMPMIVNVYDTKAGKCEKFEAQERIRTDHSEFTWEPTQRAMRGFDEK